MFCWDIQSKKTSAKTSALNSHDSAQKWPSLRSLFRPVQARSWKERSGAGWDQDGLGWPPPRDLNGSETLGNKAHGESGRDPFGPVGWAQDRPRRGSGWYPQKHLVLFFLGFSVLPRKNLKLTKDFCPPPNPLKPWKNQRKRTNNQGNSLHKINQGIQKNQGKEGQGSNRPLGLSDLHSKTGEISGKNFMTRFCRGTLANKKLVEESSAEPQRSCRI